MEAIYSFGSRLKQPFSNITSILSKFILVEVEFDVIHMVLD